MTQKRIVFALLRTPVYLLMKLAELIHAVCRWLWDRLADEVFDAQAATVSEIEQRYNIPRRQAYKIYQEIHGKAEKGIEIVYGGRESPAPIRPENPFRVRNIRNAAT